MDITLPATVMPSPSSIIGALAVHSNSQVVNTILQLWSICDKLVLATSTKLIRAGTLGWYDGPEYKLLGPWNEAMQAEDILEQVGQTRDNQTMKQNMSIPPNLPTYSLYIIRKEVCKLSTGPGDFTDNCPILIYRFLIP